jgi:hypothetical protein
MGPLLRLVISVIRLSAGEARGRVAAVSALVIGAAVLALAGAACLLVALGIWLGRHIDPALAALLMAGVAFGLAAILLLVARARARRRFGALDRLTEDPAARRLLAEFGLEGSGGQVWLPLALVAVTVFLAARRRP